MTPPTKPAPRKRATAVFLFMIGFLPAPCVGEDAANDWRLEAGPAVIDTSAENVVTGTFRVIAPPGAQAGDAPRQGGACLVADLAYRGIGLATCTTDADCNGPDAIDRSDPRLESFSGYCVSRDGSAEASRCWTRPGPPRSHCGRSVDGLRLTEGEHRLGPVDADPLGDGSRVPEWAVYACLAHEGHRRACAESNNPNRQISLTPR